MLAEPRIVLRVAVGTFGWIFDTEVVKVNKVAVDFTTYTVTAQVFAPDSDTPTIQTAQGNADGTLTYSSLADDFDCAGLWRIRLYATDGSRNWNSELAYVDVEPAGG